MDFYDGTMNCALLVFRSAKGSYKENLLSKVGFYLGNIE
jgi:hypothetical protein